MKNILVVDDQPDIRELLETILTFRDFEAELAPGGSEALARMDDGPRLPDLILLDVQMPDMDGWETLAQIREKYGDLGPRVVMCTVKGHPSDLLHGWSLGCDGYIWKPFDLKLLIDEVEAVLARSPSERTRIRRNAIAEAQLLLWPIQQGR
jgi:two-component system KDP operon response regulator KdpE